MNRNFVPGLGLGLTGAFFMLGLQLKFDDLAKASVDLGFSATTLLGVMSILCEIGASVLFIIGHEET